MLTGWVNLVGARVARCRKLFVVLRYRPARECYSAARFQDGESGVVCAVKDSDPDVSSWHGRGQQQSLQDRRCFACRAPCCKSWGDSPFGFCASCANMPYQPFGMGSAEQQAFDSYLGSALGFPSRLVHACPANPPLQRDLRMSCECLEAPLKHAMHRTSYQYFKSVNLGFRSVHVYTRQPATKPVTAS